MRGRVLFRIDIGLFTVYNIFAYILSDSLCLDICEAAWVQVYGIRCSAGDLPEEGCWVPKAEYAMIQTGDITVEDTGNGSGAGSVIRIPRRQHQNRQNFHRNDLEVIP